MRGVKRERKRRRAPKFVTTAARNTELFPPSRKFRRPPELPSNPDRLHGRSSNSVVPGHNAILHDGVRVEGQDVEQGRAMQGSPQLTPRGFLPSETAEFRTKFFQFGLARFRVFFAQFGPNGPLQLNGINLLFHEQPLLGYESQVRDSPALGSRH